MEPGGRASAPGELALAQAFVNSADLEEGIEQFDSPAALGAWLAARGLLDAGERLAAADLERALAAREALRDLLAARDAGEGAADAAGRLNAALGATALRVRFDPTGAAALAPLGGGLDGALARLMGIVHAATIAGTWERLKICRNDVCRWAFYDHSKNRSGHWCAMAICGSRVKTRAYRQRRRGA